MSKKYLYIFDKKQVKVCRFEIIKETPKNIIVNYRYGVNLLDDEDKIVYCHKERFHKDEIGNDDIWKFINTEYFADYTLKALYNKIQIYLQRQRDDYDDLIIFLRKQ